MAYRAVPQLDPRDLFTDLPAPDWEGAFSSEPPAAPEPAGLVLTVLTGSWLVLLPPAVYGVRQMARKVQGGDQEGRSGRPELR